MDQQDIWKQHTKGLTPEDLLKRINKPAQFQIELNDFLGKIIKDNNYKDLIEVGCEAGTSSTMLDKNLNITLLDLNEDILRLDEEAYKNVYPNFKYCQADMFNMPFQDESFDMVFNAGVIEHFDIEERTRAIKEYWRVLKKGGTMVIAFPNHYSLPYRFAYLIRTITKKWIFPPENKMYNLKKELQVNGIDGLQRIVLSKASIFNWNNYSPFINKCFKLLDKVFNFEGYLTVIWVKKNDHL